MAIGSVAAAGEALPFDPWERERRIDALEARGAALSGSLAAVTSELVGVLQEAATGELWQGDGFRSVEHWAAVRFGLSNARAARLVAAARALIDLPRCSAAFAAGEISEDHVVEIARAQADPGYDPEIVELAQSATITQLRKALTPLRRPEPALDPDPDAAGDEPEAEPAASGRVGFGTADDGTWGLHATGLDPVTGAVAERALRAARDALYRDRHGHDPVDEPQELADITWTDAFGRLCEAALNHLDPATAAGRAPSERYLANLHIDAEHPERSLIHLGPALPAALRSLHLCDTQVRLWITDRLGNVGLGRRQHVVDPRLRTVIEHRDGGCIVPGCGTTHNLEIHHLEHWEDGGPTETWNLAALCRGTNGHHKQAHDGRLVIKGNPDQPHTLRFTNARGKPLGPAPRPPRAGGTPPAGNWNLRSGERPHWDLLVFRELDQPPAAAPQRV